MLSGDGVAFLPFRHRAVFEKLTYPGRASIPTIAASAAGHLHHLETREILPAGDP